MDRGINPLTTQSKQQTTPRTLLETANKFSSLKFSGNNPQLDASPIEEDIDENGVRHRMRLVPGPRSYSQVTVMGEETLVFSTSITSGIRVHEFNQCFNGEGRISFRRFPGGKAHQIKEYIPINLKEVIPKTVLIQSGGNDLSTPKGHTELSVESIANEVIESGNICKGFGVKNVVISGIPLRRNRYIQERCTRLNELLMEMCGYHGFTFVDNGNIDESHVRNDGTHLNYEGSELLANNYLYYLNNLVDTEKLSSTSTS